MPRSAQCLPLVLLIVGMSAPAVAGMTDNFNDNSRSGMWALVEDSHSTLWLDETNQRLELHAAAPASSSTDALYLSSGPNGFRVKTDSDFDISIEYSFTSFTGSGSIALDLGIGKDLDGKDSAAVAFGRSSGLGDTYLVVAQRVNDAQTTWPIWPVATASTLHILYNSAGDQLTLRDDGTGYGKVLTGLVQGTWNADKVWVSFGGRGDGLTLGSGDAYLDNFSLNGDTVPAPEPATLVLTAVGALGMLLRRNCRPHAL